MIAGIDTHKDTLAVAVVDATGRQLAGQEVPNTVAGFASLVELLEQHQVSAVGIAEAITRTHHPTRYPQQGS